MAGKYNVNITDEPSETCLSAEIIANLGVLLPNLQTKQSTDCVPLREIIRSGSFAFDIGVFRLDLSVPRAFVIEVEPDMFYRKIGTGELMRFILLIILASITAILKVQAITKVPMHVSIAA